MEANWIYCLFELPVVSEPEPVFPAARPRTPPSRPAKPARHRPGLSRCERAAVLQRVPGCPRFLAGVPQNAFCALLRPFPPPGQHLVHPANWFEPVTGPFPGPFPHRRGQDNGHSCAKIPWHTLFRAAAGRLHFPMPPGIYGEFSWHSRHPPGKGPVSPSPGATVDQLTSCSPPRTGRPNSGKDLT